MLKTKIKYGLVYLLICLSVAVMSGYTRAVEASDNVARSVDNVLDGKLKLGEYKNDRGFTATITKTENGYKITYTAPKNYKKWRSYTMIQKSQSSEYFAYQEGWSTGGMHYEALPGAEWFLAMYSDH